MENERNYLEGFNIRDKREGWRDTCQFCGKKGAKFTVHCIMSEIGKKLIYEKLQGGGKLLCFKTTIEEPNGETLLREIEALVGKDRFFCGACSEEHAEILRKALNEDPQFKVFAENCPTITGWQD